MRATTFSEFLRFYRRRRGLTQEDLAARTGLGVRRRNAHRAGRIAADLESADRVAALCGGVPLALAIAGRTAFELSYRLLAPEAATLFSRLALVHGPDTSVELAAVAAGTDDAEALLEELVDASLLRAGVPGRYSFHDLVRDYARERLHSDEPDVETHRLRTHDWFLATATSHASAFLPDDQGTADLAGAHRWNCGNGPSSSTSCAGSTSRGTRTSRWPSGGTTRRCGRRGSAARWRNGPGRTATGRASRTATARRRTAWSTPGRPPSCSGRRAGRWTW
ncbi:helix-turn-helix transcriptional regulator [Lentzea californiensis]|uniref:helix-turn-helix transcriptional regulator n=1 Tax=Lentzea californiensis TaxID=438851 RepID=UPI00216622DA|nr:helix-turn-helix transcriptional regulator [Lentzea californiensis]